MAVGNVELMNESFPRHLLVETERIKQEKHNEEEGQKSSEL